MNQKKILIISRTIYPSQLPRSYRATELAKELARQGHEVILYSVLGNYNYSRFENDNTLKVKSIGTPLFATLNSDDRGRRDFFDRVLGRFLGRLIEFPDIELAFRIPRLIKNEIEVDLLITVAVPFPLHWGAALAKTVNPTIFPKVWVADCGDPYMGNMVSKKPFFYFKYVEKWFCKQANYITVPIKEAIAGYYPEYHHKIKIIPQGFRFDKADLNATTPNNPVPTFAYAGTFYKDIRDPSQLLEYLSSIVTNFKFIIYTKNKRLLNPYINRLGNRIEIREFVSRDVLLKILSTMDFLVNIDNGTSIQSPSKLIDYAIINRPILSITSDLVDKNKIDLFLKGDYSERYVVDNIEQYKIENVAEKFLSLLSN
jgi:hypothetical protein